MSSKCSPGPWTWEDGYLRSSDGMCVIWGQEYEIPRRADMQLIAAAPRMLELLRMLDRNYQGALDLAKKFAEFDVQRRALLAEIDHE